MPRLVFDFPDATDPAGPSRRVAFVDPVEVLVARTPAEVRPALARVQEATGQGLHAAGYLAYEAAPAFDPAMRVHPGAPLPLLWFGLFETPHEHASDAERAPVDRDRSDDPLPPPLDWTMDIDRAAHAAAIATIREAIAEGRTYQVNLTARLRAPFRGDPAALYDRLRRAQGHGYHACLDLDDDVILSVSPELFFHTRGRRITTRPMKGTRPRGRWTGEDRALEAELRSAAKDRAESLMIVDLLRNDLGRICDTGSIQVPRLHDVERYRTVWQMTSTVAGRLRQGVGLDEIFAALFPCGSVTGAPKISTMAEIARLEPSPRGVYCGAIGWVRPGGDSTFNIPIRTAWLDRRRARIEYGAGGGVVWDSTAEGEYDELRAKAVVVREPWPRFALLETLRLEDGRYVRQERHLRRMLESARYFDFPDPTTAVPAALEDLARRHPAGAFLARVTFHDDGTASAGAAPLDDTGTATPGEGGTAPRTVVVAWTAVDSSDRFLFHKTTHRRVHDARRAEAGADAFDVLLHNERGELTEFTRGNLVMELDGRRVTPPRSAGLLAGCLRQELLDTGAITEATLRPADLERATRVWFINSARGWIEVEPRVKEAVPSGEQARGPTASTPTGRPPPPAPPAGPPLGPAPRRP